MMLGLGLSLSLTGQGGGAWSPARLGASLLGWWDAERADKLTLSGSSVTTWADIVGGYAATQALGAAKPTYSATGFNGRPGIPFDGVDDELTLAGVPFPSGAAASRVWLLLDQTALPADTAVRYPFAYGNGSASERRVRRVVVSGVNRGGTSTGNGGGSTLAVDGLVDLSGRHVMLATFGPTDSSISVDGAAPTSVAAVPATATSRTRIGALAVSTASAFFQGVLNTILIDDGSPAAIAQDPKIIAYLKARGGIA